jgi:D-glycero-D-manno-heptose 1,7-bisphosphate phosphatase
MTEAAAPVVFVDRDGVINRNRSDYVKSWAEFRFLPGSLRALAALNASGYRVIVVTNQSAVNRGLMGVEDLDEIHGRMGEIVAANGGRIEAILYCPHRPDEGCGCRKPRPGLFRRAASELRVDLAAAYYIGDSLSDVDAARAAGVRPILVWSGRGLRAFLSREARARPAYRVARSLPRAVALVLRQDGRLRYRGLGRASRGARDLFWESWRLAGWPLETGSPARGE